MVWPVLCRPWRSAKRGSSNGAQRAQEAGRGGVVQLGGACDQHQAVGAEVVADLEAGVKEFDLPTDDRQLFGRAARHIVELRDPFARVRG